MRRTSLLVASGGAAVVLAMTGAALGVAVNDASTPPRGSTLVADDTATPSPFESPSESFPSQSPSVSDSPSLSESPATDSPFFSPSAKAKAKAPMSGGISVDRAKAIALAHAGGGRVFDTEAEFEHGRPVWKIELVKGGAEYRVDVDRETGAIVRFRLERGDRDGDDGHRDDNSGSGSGSDDDSGDNSGSGSGSDDDSGDNSGSGSGSDDDSGDNSGSGSGSDDDSGDNSGSGSGSDDD
jgi:hypothetical protein